MQEENAVKRERGTRIVATIGPSTSEEAVLRRLIRAGTDAFRLNMSHGTRDEHARALRRLRSAAAAEGSTVGVLVDLQGARLRTGPNIEGALVPLRRGEEVLLRFEEPGADAAPSRPGSLLIPSRDLAGSIGRGDRLLLDDGKLELAIEGRARGSWRARVERGGMLKERAGINIPGRVLAIRIPTPKDVEDIAFALRHRADWIALSFVQTAEDVRAVRKLLPGPSSRRKTPLVMAKLEKPAALTQLDAIIEESDGVLVARGDMGVELSLEKVPYWQKEILRRARERGRVTMTATQMLESMISRPTPTRAEVSDVANAILDGTDSLLLTAETAVGQFPVESVQMLVRIARETDRMWMAESECGGCGGCGDCGGDCGGNCGGSGASGDEDGHAHGHTHGHAHDEGSCSHHHHGRPTDPMDAMARAAVELAEEVGARRILAFTWSGATARLLARHRPSMPILALTPREETRNQLTLTWNTEARILPKVGSVEEMMRHAILLARKERLVKRGDTVVFLAGSGRLKEATNLLRLVDVT